LRPEEYLAWYRSVWGFHAHAQEAAAVLAAASPSPGELFLDLGSGPGTYAFLLKARGARPVLLDTDRRMLQAARGRGLAWLVQGEAEALPFRPDAFPGVVAVAVLEFVGSPERALGEVERVLAPGGRAVLGIFNRESPWARRARRRPAYAQARFFLPEEVLLLAPRLRLALVGRTLFLWGLPLGRRGIPGGILGQLARAALRLLGAFLEGLAALAGAPPTFLALTLSKDSVEESDPLRVPCQAAGDTFSGAPEPHLPREGEEGRG
jgi:SAM-dependent methyltransferase